jgi:hypothetical protein
MCPRGDSRPRLSSRAKLGRVLLPFRILRDKNSPRPSDKALFFKNPGLWFPDETRSSSLPQCFARWLLDASYVRPGKACTSANKYLQPNAGSGSPGFPTRPSMVWRSVSAVRIVHSPGYTGGPKRRLPKSQPRSSSRNRPWRYPVRGDGRSVRGFVTAQEHPSAWDRLPERVPCHGSSRDCKLPAVMFG